MNKLSHYLEDILKEYGRIISYEFINLILIVFIETTKLIKVLMIQPSMSVSRERSFYMYRILKMWLRSQHKYKYWISAMNIRIYYIILTTVN